LHAAPFQALELGTVTHFPSTLARTETRACTISYAILTEFRAHGSFASRQAAFTPRTSSYGWGWSVERVLATAARYRTSLSLVAAPAARGNVVRAGGRLR